jgi:hypothetical protein
MPVTTIPFANSSFKWIAKEKQKWEAGAIIILVLAVDLCMIGIYKALRRTTKGCDKKTKR